MRPDRQSLYVVCLGIGGLRAVVILCGGQCILIHGLRDLSRLVSLCADGSRISVRDSGLYVQRAEGQAACRDDGDESDRNGGNDDVLFLCFCSGVGSCVFGGSSFISVCSHIVVHFCFLLSIEVCYPDFCCP